MNGEKDDIKDKKSDHVEKPHKQGQIEENKESEANISNFNMNDQANRSEFYQEQFEGCHRNNSEEPQNQELLDRERSVGIIPGREPEAFFGTSDPISIGNAINDTQFMSESGLKEIISLLKNKDIVHGRLNKKLYWLILLLVIICGGTRNMQEYHGVTIISDPNSKGVYYNWGSPLKMLKNYTEAAEKYTRVTIIDQNFKEAYFTWGNTLLNQGEYQEAAKKYERATTIDPNYKQAYFNWGNTLRMLKNNTEAAEKYERATIIDPTYKEAYFSWGNILLNQGEYQEAAKKYERATTIDPNYKQAYFNWGLALENLGEYQEAADKFERSTDNSTEGHLNSGNALARLEEDQEAADKYERVTYSTEAHLNSGNAIARSEEDQEAWERFPVTIGVGKWILKCELHRFILSAVICVVGIMWFLKYQKTIQKGEHLELTFRRSIYIDNGNAFTVEITLSGGKSLLKSICSELFLPICKQQIR